MADKAVIMEGNPRHLNDKMSVAQGLAMRKDRWNRYQFQCSPTSVDLSNTRPVIFFGHVETAQSTAQSTIPEFHDF